MTNIYIRMYSCSFIPVDSMKINSNDFNDRIKLMPQLFL